MGGLVGSSSRRSKKYPVSSTCPSMLEQLRLQTIVFYFYMMIVVWGLLL
jgi:hypothetical protein